jgi:hypothetical protein
VPPLDPALRAVVARDANSKRYHLLLRDAGWRHREKVLMAGTPQPEGS